MTSGGIRLLYETEVEQLAVEHARKVLAYYDANIDSGQTSALHEVPFVFFGKMLTHEDDETGDIHTPSPVAAKEEPTEPKAEDLSDVNDIVDEVNEEQEDTDINMTQGVEEESEDSLQDDFDELMHQQPESSEESAEAVELSVVESVHDEAEEKSHVVNLDANNSSQPSGSFSFDDVDEEDDFNTVSTSSGQSQTAISSQEDTDDELLEKEQSSYVVDINSVPAPVLTSQEDEIDVFGREDEDDLAALSDVTPPKEPVSVVEVPVEKHNAHEHVDNVSPNSSVVTNEWGLFDTEENLAAERKPVRRKTSRVNLDDIE